MASGESRTGTAIGCNCIPVRYRPGELKNVVTVGAVGGAFEERICYAAAATASDIDPSVVISLEVEPLVVVFYSCTTMRSYIEPDDGSSTLPVTNICLH